MNVKRTFRLRELCVASPLGMSRHFKSYASGEHNAWHVSQLTTSTNRRNLTVCTFTGMQITQLQCDHTVQQASGARRSQASELCTKGVNENGSAGLCDGERPAAVRRNVLCKCVSLQRHAAPVRNNKEEKRKTT